MGPGMAARYGNQIRCVPQNNAGARKLGIFGSARPEVNLCFSRFRRSVASGKIAAPDERFEARPELDLSLTYLQNFWIPELEKEKAWFQDHRLAGALPGYVRRLCWPLDPLLTRSGCSTTL